MDKDRIINTLNKITEWSLYILIFCLPFSKSIVEITITIAFISWISKKILTKDFKLKKTPLDILLLALFLSSAVSIINTDFKLLVAKALFTKLLKYIVLYFVMVETVNSEAKLKNLLKMAFVSAIIVMVDTYIQYYLVHVDIIRLYPSFKYAPLTDPNPNFLGFPTGPFPFPNDLSAWMLIVLMSVLYIFIWGIKSFSSRLILGIFLLPFLFLFYLANTRSAWLGFFASFFITLLIMNKKIIILLLLLIVIISLSFLPTEKIANVLGFTSMQDRFYMWRIGWKIFLEHPILGNGFNSFFLKFKEFREDEYKNEKGSYAHNGFLQLAADTGILGLTVFLLLLAKLFVTIFRYVKEKTTTSFYGTFALGLAAGLLAFLMHSFFDTNLQSLPLVTLFWFSIALLMSANNIKFDTLSK